MLLPNSSLTPQPQKQEIQTVQQKKKPMILDEETFVGSIFKSEVWPRIVDGVYYTICSSAEKLCYGTIGSKRSFRNGAKDRNSLFSYDKATANKFASEYQNGYLGEQLFARADRYRTKVPNQEWGRGMGLTMDDISEIGNQMAYRFDAAGILTVADMYDIFGIGDIPHTAHNIGWNSLAGVQSKNDLDNPGSRYIFMPPPVNVK